jgi:tetratricopeptide (TPR) repeat protein/predicted MPP superfamily phosphohydrolase
MDILRWIHLSDIHFSGKEEYATKRMRDTILKKIGEVSKGKHVDMVFITGDLAFQGGAYDSNLKIFIETLMEMLTISPDELFMIPGNHDLCRSQMRTLTIEGARKGDFKFEKDTIKQLQKDFKKYKTFYKKIKGENADYIYKLIKKGKYNVFLMNTAFTAGTDNDDGNLVLEKECFYDEIKLLKDQKCSVNIAIGHHPISYFVKADRQKIWNLFNDCNIDFYLCGHLHKRAYDFDSSGQRTIPAYQCGSGKVDSYATVTFFVGELDIEKKTGKLVSYKWMPNEECWVIGGMDGRKAISGKIDIVLKHQLGKTPEFEEKDVVKFNEPDVGRDLYITMYQEQERQFVVTHNVNIKPVSYFVGRETDLQNLRNRIEEGHKSVLVSGMGGIGKTQICRKLFEEYCDKHSRHENVPYQHIGYIEYNEDMNSSLQNCLRFKKQENPELNQEAAWRELEYLASDGKLLLFVDNVDKQISEDSGWQRLKNIPGTVVLTSRQISFSDKFELYPVGFLNTEQCIELFERILFEGSDGKTSTEERPDLEYIIEKLAGKHTITVEHLAYLCKWKVLSIKKLRKALEEKGFQLQFRKNGELINIQKTYEVLYDLSELTEAEQNILEAFSVLPYIPLAAEVCDEWMLADAGVSEEDYIFMGLYQKGWLQFDIVQANYALHPVFAQFIYEKCKPKAENHFGLIEACRQYLKIPESGSAINNQKFVLFAENISVKLIRENNEEQANFISDIAYLMYYIAEYKKAEELYKKALEISEQILGEEHPSTATSYNNLAGVYASQGEYKKAEELYKKALGIRERILGEEHLPTATSYNNLAGVYASQGEYRKAEELYKKALEIREWLLGKEHPSTATSYNNLAGVYASRGEYKKAEELYKKALEISKRLLGDKHPSTAISYSNLAGVYASQGEYKKAEKLYKKALEISKRLLGEEHPDTATSYNNLAGVYASQGEYKKAEELYKKALEIRERLLGEKHPDTATNYNNLAGVYASQGEYKKAEELYKKALEIRERVLGEEHPDTAASYNNLAGVYASQGEYKKAEELYKKALEISKWVLGEEHPDTATSYNNLAWVYDSQGEYKKAEELYKKALEIRERVLGEEHPDTAASYNNLAGVYASQGEYKKAEELYKKALEISKRLLGEEHPSTATSYNNLAGVYDSQGEYKKAEELYKKALEIRERLLGEEHPSTATSYNNLAGVYDSQGEYKKAEELYKKALEIREQILGEEHPSTATSYNNLAGVYDSQGEYKKAEELYKKALEIRERVLGEEHPSTATSYNNLAGVYASQGEYKKALRYYQKSYNILLLKLGQNHPSTQRVYENMKLEYFEWNPEGDFGQWLEENIKR